ncbi:MAG: hypothetical protein QM753_16125 [Thermomicrobiales bacterium]
MTEIALSPVFEEDGFVLVEIPGGIGRSSDGDDSRTFAELPGPLSIVSFLLIVQDTTGLLLLARTLEDGVARYTDGGATWLFWNGGLFDHEVIALDLDEERKIIGAETTSGIAVSINGGRAWRFSFLD